MWSEKEKYLMAEERIIQLFLQGDFHVTTFKYWRVSFCTERVWSIMKFILLFILPWAFSVQYFILQAGFSAWLCKANILILRQIYYVNIQCYISIYSQILPPKFVFTWRATENNGGERYHMRYLLTNVWVFFSSSSR